MSEEGTRGSATGRIEVKQPSPAPQVGTLKVKYHKTVVYQGCCRTCEPEWRGPMESRRAIAQQQAIFHALKVHKWMPNV